jgi:hypothetical protein
VSTELAIQGELPVAKYATEENFEVSTSAGYLPRVQMMDSNNKLVKQNKFPQGHFALIRDQSITDLTSEFNCIVIGWRPKAMQFNPDVISYYDPNSEGFKKLAARAELPNSGCGYGAEFLIYLPDYECFATYFLGNKTGRREAGNFKAFLKKACTIKAKFIETKKFSWWGSEPVACDIGLEGPDSVKLFKVIDRFNNPPESEVEVADEQQRDR